MSERTTILATVFALACAGCAVELDADDKLPRLGQPKTPGCIPSECGNTNGNVHLGNRMDYFMTQFGASTGVWTVEGATMPDGQTAEALELGWDTLIFIDAGGAQVQGSGLVGGSLILTLHGEFEDLPVTVEIVGHLSQPHAGTDTPMSKFLMAFSEGLDGNVCDDLDLNPSGEVWAVIVPEDRFDQATTEVQHLGPGVFNIACIGSTAGKIKTARRGKRDPLAAATGTPASLSNPALVTKSAQAMMKMLSGDFCGNGDSLTQQGTPLFWYDAEGTVDTSTGASAEESHWDESGASCLSQHRLQMDISDHCTLPQCAGPLSTTLWSSMVNEG